MKFKLQRFVFFIHICFANFAFAQVPHENEVMPYFNLVGVEYYSRSNFSNSDLLGKWTIFDFWSKGCVSCVKSFPRLNKLQEEFKDDIQILLVGQSDIRYNKNIRDVYEKYRVVMSLNIMSVYDSVLSVKFGVPSYPYTIIVDPKGIVYAITSSEAITSSKIKDLIENRKPIFKKVYSKYDSKSFVGSKAWEFYIDGNKSLPEEVIFRSILSKYNGESIVISPRISDTVEQGVYQYVGISLFRLFNAAYFGTAYWNAFDMQFYGKYWMKPVLELKDTSMFVFDYVDDIGLYNYCIFLREKNLDIARFMEVMQKDLAQCFGYNVTIEKRYFPCWRLTATQKARKSLLTRKKDKVLHFDYTNFAGYNISIKEDLLTIIDYYGGSQIPYIDETGINGNVDVVFDAVLSDFKDVQKKLAGLGLVFELVNKEMTVLVIRDSI